LISKTNQYAIRAVLYLAQGSGSPVPAAEIAQGLELPANYLSKILHALARAGVLESGRGPRGGFRLARAAKTVSLAEVMAPFDPFVNQRTCLLGQSQCSDAAPCRLHDSWKKASDPVVEFFNETMIADLAGNVDLCL
jgi:Rrf2 family protein